MQDFTTGSRTLFKGNDNRILCLNISPDDAAKHRSQPLVADIRASLAALHDTLSGWKAPEAWTAKALPAKTAWLETAARYLTPDTATVPTDAQVIGAVQRQAKRTDVVVGAAGGLPGELHKHWQSGGPGGYHMEYGFSCMGYEIAGGLGVKMAQPDREVFVLVGDGSYLMLNSEIATSIMLGRKLVVVLLDNGG